jgi:hypothetical protein
VTWEQDFSMAAVGTVGETSKGSARLWHLPQLAAPDQAKLSALVQGPGTLEWEASHSQLRVTLEIHARPGVIGVSQSLRTSGPESFILPSHQLALPSGMHRVQWLYERGGVFNGGGGALGLAVRWIPSSRPVLQAAVGLSPSFFTYFRSDGGWIPQPFSFADPKIRLRTRFSGTGSIQLGGTGFPLASPIFGTEQNWGDFWARDQIVGLSMPYENLLTWSGPGGERGVLMEPFPVLRVGNITSQIAYAGETIGLWANRQQVGPNPNSDPDGDGLSWLVESAMGLNPHYPEPEAYEIQPGTPPKARFPWPPIIPEGITRIAEVSADLTNWVSVAPVVTDGIAVVEVRAPNNYVRVRVVQH